MGVCCFHSMRCFSDLTVVRDMHLDERKGDKLAPLPSPLFPPLPSTLTCICGWGGGGGGEG